MPAIGLIAAAGLARSGLRTQPTEAVLGGAPVSDPSVRMFSRPKVLCTLTAPKSRTVEVGITVIRARLRSNVRCT